MTGDSKMNKWLSDRYQTQSPIKNTPSMFFAALLTIIRSGNNPVHENRGLDKKIGVYLSLWK